MGLIYQITGFKPTTIEEFADYLFVRNKDSVSVSEIKQHFSPEDFYHKFYVEFRAGNKKFRHYEEKVKNFKAIKDSLEKYVENSKTILALSDIDLIKEVA